MEFRTLNILSLVLRLLFVLTSPVACSTTLGAPQGDDTYDAESAADAMEEEEEENAWDDANR
jgi:hypothetical protein